MACYIEKDRKYAFQPGCYIEEINEDSGLSLQEIAWHLERAPESLNQLICCKQSLTEK